MSVLSNLRLAFAGRFQADTSTVNNDVRHFDNATFEPRFQQLSEGPIENGWWNPNGSGAFRLIDCVVTQVSYADGSNCTNPNYDRVIGMAIGGSADRVSGKIVDLDPQMQMVSQLWGLDVGLSPGANTMLFKGRYLPASFRDIIFGRLLGVGADGGASAMFRSVLQGVEFSDDLVRYESRFLDALKQACTNETLSIRLSTFRYLDHLPEPGFSMGKVVGVIAPYVDGQPKTFVAGRRFVPENGLNTPENMTVFDGQINPSVSLQGATTPATLNLDLSNALPIVPVGHDGYAMQDIGPLKVAAISNNGDTIANGMTTPLSNLTILGDIDYMAKDWMNHTGGVASIPLTESQAEIAGKVPLALVSPTANSQEFKICIRETPGGYFVRADENVLRVNSSTDDSSQAVTSCVYVTQYGQPAKNVQVDFALAEPESGTGIGNPSSPDQPKAPIPVIGTPQTSVRVPASVNSDASGIVVLNIETKNPGNPRGYIDGQIYNVTYRLPCSDYKPYIIEGVWLHVYDPYKCPEEPTWHQDIQPIMQQYGNLYPVMSKWLVNLGNMESCLEHRKILKLAFSLPQSDPNFMPVTRDLSSGKLQAILKWLDHPKAGTSPSDEASSSGPQPRKASPEVGTKKHSSAEPSVLHHKLGSKERAMERMKHNRGWTKK